MRSWTSVTISALMRARQVLAEMGVVLTPGQMKRAADKDSEGRRKLPFLY